ncbi:L-type lectin-domain containing receptor kinase IV.1-like, partial [Trifolium medium]|nr:L-type lectin-domain containing receptor kinase IV.1-like [Trifolium medium]
GTVGYLAPEHTRTGKATKFTDVFAFGAFLLEVVCGKRPIDHVGENETVILVDSVFECWKREPMARPSMRQVVQYLERDIPLPDLSLLSLSSSGLTFGYQEFFEDFPMSYPSTMDKTMSHTSVSIADSLL